MLCAFFEKRMRGDEAEESTELMDALFGPFWTSVQKFGKATIAGTRRPGVAQHWRARDEWRRNAELDDTADALALLEFRINRLCKLLTVCDCWPSSVGRHLAHWIDSHVHLALEVEARRAGPIRDETNESSPGARWLSLTDWRRVDPLDVFAMREVVIVSARPAFKKKKSQSRATFYRKIVENVTACKNIGETIRGFATDQSRQKTTCAALIRCALGYDAHRANFALRMAAHAALADGPSVACDRMIEAMERGGSTTSFIAFREFIVRNVATDADASAHLARKPRWDAYAANVVHAAETVRVRTRDRRPDGANQRLVFEDDFIASSNDEETTALNRVCKKVPGPFVRAANRAISVFDACKIVRRVRNRANAPRFFGGIDTFDDSGGSIVETLFRTRDRDTGASFDLGDLARVLRTERSRTLFVEASRAMRLNAEALRTIALRESAATEGGGVPFSKDFGLVSDALELVRHFANVSAHALPESIAERQRAAVRRNFADRRCDDAEMFRRRGEILWCVGCKKVKNFVVSSDIKNADNHLATGYARVCHVGEEIVCDEKKTYPCCEALPLRRATVLDASKSRCVRIYGTAYVVTTCCGKLATLEHVTCSVDEVFVCRECATRRLREVSARGEGDGVSRARTCRFCHETVGKQKGSFTGTFVEEDGSTRTHTFCKRHVRAFMRREFEPLNLDETLREIPKTMKVS